MKSTWKEMAGKIKECASVVAVFKGQVKICLSLSFNTKKTPFILMKLLSFTIILDIKRPAGITHFCPTGKVCISNKPERISCLTLRHKT